MLVRSAANGTVVGVHGSILAPSTAARGQSSNRDVTGEFDLRASAVIVASGGIGGDPDLVRAQWPARLGPPPSGMLAGVPAHVDGRLLAIAEAAGARLINGDRMWHYPEGIVNHHPVWPRHGIRILPGPSSLWLDATGTRLPAPLFPGFDTLGTLEHLLRTGYEHSWFLLNQTIIEKEFALSGSEQNPDLTGKDLALLARRLRPGAPGPVEDFKRQGEDFVVANNLPALIKGMQERSPGVRIDRIQVEREALARDRELDNEFSKDAQINAIRLARHYRGDKLQIGRAHV